jgi:anti-anti-sigma regulatory factor
VNDLPPQTLDAAGAQTLGLPVVVEHAVGVEEIDAHTVGDFAEELLGVLSTVAARVPDGAPAVVVLDLSGTRLMAACAVRALQDAVATLRAGGHEILVVRAPRAVTRAIALLAPDLLSEARAVS